LIASSKNHSDCITQLVAAGGEVNKCDNDGQSPVSLTLDNAMNSVIHNGFVYMTLAGNSPQSNQIRSKYKKFYFLNDAWHICPVTPDTLHVCSAHPWSTPALFFADDSAYFTALPQMTDWPQITGFMGRSVCGKNWKSIYKRYLQHNAHNEGYLDIFDPGQRCLNLAGLKKTQFDQYEVKQQGNYECVMYCCDGRCGCCSSDFELSPIGAESYWRPDVLIRRKI
jgi:hypothetical protein